MRVMCSVAPISYGSPMRLPNRTTEVQSAQKGHPMLGDLWLFSLSFFCNKTTTCLGDYRHCMRVTVAVTVTVVVPAQVWWIPDLQFQRFRSVPKLNTSPSITLLLSSPATWALQAFLLLRRTENPLVGQSICTSEAKRQRRLTLTAVT